MNNAKRRAIALAKVRDINCRIIEYTYLVHYGKWAVRALQNKLQRNPVVSQDAIDRAESWSVNVDSFAMFYDGLGTANRKNRVNCKLTFEQHQTYANFGTNGIVKSPANFRAMFR